MSDPHVTASPEQAWLAWLGQRNDQIASYLNAWPPRALNAAELQGVLSTLDQYLQELNNARPEADQLSRQGAPNFAQQLDAAIQGLQSTRSTVQQMYVSTAATEAQIAQIEQSTRQATGQIWGNIADSMRVAQNQSHQAYIDRLNGNCYVCHRYIGIPGGGYCPLHGPRPA